MKPQPCTYPLPEDERLLIFDGYCRLCSGWARFVLRYDHDATITMATVQSAVGNEILSELRVNISSPETVVFVERGTAYFKSDAIFRIIAKLRWPWQPLRVFEILPRGLRDWAYSLIARNRYRLFGRREVCFLPQPEYQDRFRDDPP